MDFYTIDTESKDGEVKKVFPNFIVGPSKDLMIRGGRFYAFWDEDKNVWVTDELALPAKVDRDVYEVADKYPEAKALTMRSFNSTVWEKYKRFERSMADSYTALDQRLFFSNQETKREDYSSKKLPYALQAGDCSAWHELMDTLYTPVEKAKIEWAIGSVVAGDSTWIQKFLVFYGPAGSGKSTVLRVIEKLFEGYTASFDAKSLGDGRSQFAMESLSTLPLVAIQHDGDLSRILDNTKLNALIAHEPVPINEKHKRIYHAQLKAMLFMGTNQPVKITDAKSGVLRRLIDVEPSGRRLAPDVYHHVMSHIDFELGAIASHCLGVYKKMGSHYYDAYKPQSMMYRTDEFYNFVTQYYDEMRTQPGVTVKQAYAWYKEFCNDTGISTVLPQYKFRDELMNYFEEFHHEKMIEQQRYRSIYIGFKLDMMGPEVEMEEAEVKYDITLYEVDALYHPCILDQYLADMPAQYAKPGSGQPGYKWENVKATLKDLDTTRLHYVKVPDNHIVIDFDLVDEDGEKSLELNLKAASEWPDTYAEVSKSGQGLHLHYIYTGDKTELGSVYSPGIEVKTLVGDSSLRRKLTLCNTKEIAKISSGLPKKEKKVLDAVQVRNEKLLRRQIADNLMKKVHPGTKSSVDFIHHLLEEAYESGMKYDVTDMRNDILTFAMNSTNQSDIAVKTVMKMKFASEDEDAVEEPGSDAPIVFFDVEVYPNLFVVCWKPQDKPMDKDAVAKMINPTPAEVEELMTLKLVGFNNRKYDNHILYARFMGYSNEALFDLSTRIINNDREAMFREAYGLSFADIYDFSSKKQGLKKFQIEYGLNHQEMHIPWDAPVPEELIPDVVDYCCNDVLSTQHVFEARSQDFVAREILASVSGLPINDTTQKHTARIIFGHDKEPQKSFVYTDLSGEFPGYVFDSGTSSYRGEDPGEGGYVYAEPGIYEDVALLDIASMHPASIDQLNLFGPYTDNFRALRDARLAIKHQDYTTARTLLDGKLAPFLHDAEDNPDSASDLAYALKIVINIVYGLTSAKFPNPFKDNRNVDNIVAKRGALFMIDLKHALQDMGVTVAHIKTDSVKIPHATEEVVQFVMDFGKKYGYDFEHEATYDKLFLANDAVYIARSGEKWTAVGAQFQHPYVFKTLLSKEPIEFADICEARSVVKGAMYLDFKGNKDVAEMAHVGRTGLFVPVLEGGGHLYRVDGDKIHSVQGTKDYKWIQADAAKAREEEYELFVDLEHFEGLVRDAIDSIEKYGPFEEFVK